MVTFLNFRCQLIVALALLTSHVSMAAAAGCSGFVTTGPVVEEVRSLEERGAARNVTGQVKSETEQMLAPEYYAVSPDGSVASRSDLLKGYVDGKLPGWATAFSIKSLDVRVYCDAAVVTGLADAAGKDAKGETRNAQFRWLNVWHLTVGGWRLGASQFARR